MTRWVINVAVAIDQLVNAVAGGDPDETISSRAGKAATTGHRGAIALEAAINLIFAIAIGERNHCANRAEA